MSDSFYSKKYSELDQATLGYLRNYITHRWGQLYGLEKEWGTSIVQYLFLTNSGGAIATLSFLGASDEARNLASAIIALILFALGIFVVGIGKAYGYHRTSSLFTQYKDDVDRFFNDKLTWGDLTDNDNQRSKSSCWVYAIACTAFACFIGGCFVGAIGLFFGKCA